MLNNPKESKSAYKSPRLRATITTIALCISILVMLLSILHAYADNRLTDTILSGGTVPDEILTDSYENGEKLLKAWYAARFITAITFLSWLFRASRNLRPLGLHKQQNSPYEAVFFWFIPLANFVLPYRVVKELWRGSNPLQTTQPNTRHTPIHAAIGPWWAAWLSSSLLLLLARLTYSPDNLEADKTLNNFNSASDAIGVLAATLAILIVHAITTSQDTSYKTLSQSRTTPKQ